MVLLIAAAAFVFVSCERQGPEALVGPSGVPSRSYQGPTDNIRPKPQSVLLGSGTFTLDAGSGITVQPGTEELIHVGEILASTLRSSTGYAVGVQGAFGPPAAGNIFLTTVGGDPLLGEEGYSLTITDSTVILSAYQPAGLMRGIQTIRQLFPAAVESPSTQPGPWTLPACTIRDFPRFAWRGVMLDISRHFFGVTTLKRVIDLVSYYKINRFHLHISDDEGWRLAINARPNLAILGGNLPGRPAGYLTQADYQDVVAYARERYITIVPEFDMPGHFTAALYAEKELAYPGHQWFEKDAAWPFLEDVFREVAALTPGPYIHIGGDEAYGVPQDKYNQFIDSVQALVQKYGKQIDGWADIANGHLRTTSLAQYWYPYDDTTAGLAVQQGVKLIMSPANKSYLDQKYNSSTVLGLSWAGYIEVQTAYQWDPATIVAGVSEGNIVGVEAPLWAETLLTIADIEYMMFPRLIGEGEIGWSSVSGRSWDEYKVRLGSHGPRLTALGVNFYRSTQVPWQ